MKGSEVTQVVVFKLSDEIYAIDIFDVREIVEEKKITKIPNVPEYIDGILDLRGEITTVVNLKKLLNIPEKDGRTKGKIIVIDADKDVGTVGFIVDTVLSVTEVESIEPLSAIASTSAISLDESYIKGIIKGKERLIILLDVDAILKKVSK